MHPLRKNLKNIPVIKVLSSIKITVTCLSLLIVLTFWGTVAQVDQGLYTAQSRFFNSYWFTFLGFIPFPGAQLVLWVLFINLVCNAITRFVYKWSHAGIMVIHIGLLTYFVAAFVTLHVVEESHVSFMEGEGTNVSSAYFSWELAFSPSGQAGQKEITAVDVRNLKAGDMLSIPSLGLTLTAKTYHRNAKAYTTSSVPEALNESGITQLTQARLEIEPERNTPGGIFEVRGTKPQNVSVLLYGADPNPVRITLEKGEYDLVLRRKHFPLPFTILLKDFQMEKYPGTEVAKTFKSYVDIKHEGVEREVLIYMNHPLRYKNYTLYQSSYSIDDLGREHSTLAVVRNSGRLLPYIASFVTFGGLSLHFLMMAFAGRIRKNA